MAALEGLGFAVDWVDRGSYWREDPAEVARLRALDDARALLIARDMPVLRNGESGLDSPPADERDRGARRGAGRGAAGPCVRAARRSSPRCCRTRRSEMRSDASDGFLDRRVLVVPGREDLKLVDLRSIAVGGLLPPDQTAMLAAAKALMHWHARHRFCSNCGAPTEVAVAGWRRDCKVCKATHFPRTDPVVIMLAVDGRRLPARPPAPVPEGHVFGAGRIRRARGDHRGGCAGARSARRPASYAARCSILPRSPGRSPPR